MFTRLHLAALAVVGLAALVLLAGPSAPARAQQGFTLFYGDAASGSGALIDRAPAPDGAVVTAVDDIGGVLGEVLIEDGAWRLEAPNFPLAEAAVFFLNGRQASGPRLMPGGGGAVVLTTSATPAHRFHGDAASATIDGAPVADGEVVLARNDAGDVVGRDVIEDGAWDIAVDTAYAPQVRFFLAFLAGPASAALAVEAGGDTAVSLAAATSATRHLFHNENSGGGRSDADVAPEGARVSARNEAGDEVAWTRVHYDRWSLVVRPEDAVSVTLYVEGQLASPVWLVEAGGSTLVTLATALPEREVHEFYGDATDLIGAEIDGMLAPDGTVVTARNEHDDLVGSATIEGGAWLIEVDPLTTDTVRFYLNGRPASVYTFLVVPGAREAPVLSATSLVPMPLHQFLGDAETGMGVTIDGEPAPDCTTVSAVTPDGVVVDRTTVEEGLWAIVLDPAEVDSVRFLVDGSEPLDAGPDPYPVTPGGVTFVPLPAAGAVQHYAQGWDVSGQRWGSRIVSGFTAATFHALPGSSGPGASASPADVFASLGDRVQAVYAWDGAQFLVWRPEGPTFANTLTTVTPGSALFIDADALDAAAWCQGPPIQGPRTVALSTGLNFVSWTGPELTPVGEALRGIAGLEAAFLWDAASQSYRTYRPGVPAALNTLDVLPYSAALWVRVTADAVWEQPARDGSLGIARS